MIAIGVGNNILVDRKILLAHPGQPRRVVAHEGVLEMVDSAVINRGEIPGLRRQQLRRRRVDRHRLRNDFAQGVKALVRDLVHFLVLGHEQPDEFAAQLHGIHPQFRQRCGEGRRMNHPRRQRPRCSGFSGGILEMVRYHHTVQRFSGMRRPPTHHQGAVAGLIEDIPDRLGFARQQGDRTHPGTIRQRFGEPVDAVFVGSFARGNRGPKHRAQHRVDRRHVAVHARGHEPGQVRHPSGIEQRPDHFPVSRIPTDEQHACFGHKKPLLKTPPVDTTTA